MKPLSWLMPGGTLARHQILIFHRVQEQHDPLVPDVPSAAQFDALVSLLCKMFRIIPLSEAVARAPQGSLPSASLSITFDDGYADNFTQALPILEKHGAHATFFVATGFLNGGCMWNDTITETVRLLPDGKYPHPFVGEQNIVLRNNADRRSFAHLVIEHCKHLPMATRSEMVAQFAKMQSLPLPCDLMLSTKQLMAMDASPAAEIGAHTRNHPILTKLSQAEARREIIQSFEDLENLLGKRPKVFAYPNGKVGRDYLPEHAQWLSTQDVAAAVTTDWGVLTSKTDPMQIPRFSPWHLAPWRYATDLVRARYGWY